jgi:uncharacterized membrane protein YkvA (DUF1232 family)
MPVFDFDFAKSCTNLDMSAARSGIFTPNLTSLELHDHELTRFNDLARRLAPGQPAFTLDQIAGAARRVLRAAAKGQDSTFIKVRMRRAGEMRAAWRDVKWSMAPALKADLSCLLDYLDSDTGLIPNHIPTVGLLDDSILVDVAMNKFRTELDEYADFCRFRVAEAAHQDIAIDAVDIDRNRWFVERQQEQRLEQQLRRVRSSSYAKTEGSDRAFRIC